MDAQVNMIHLAQDLLGRTRPLSSERRAAKDHMLSDSKGHDGVDGEAATYIEQQAIEADAIMMDELSNQLHDDDDIIDLMRDQSTENLNISRLNPSRIVSPEPQSDSVVCDFAHNISFTFCPRDSEITANSGNLPQKHKIRQLRLVDGRLQVVGFPADLPECSKTRRAPRRRRKDNSEFWSEVVSFLLK